MSIALINSDKWASWWLSCVDNFMNSSLYMSGQPTPSKRAKQRRWAKGKMVNDSHWGVSAAWKGLHFWNWKDEMASTFKKGARPISARSQSPALIIIRNYILERKTVIQQSSSAKHQVGFSLQFPYLIKPWFRRVQEMNAIESLVSPIRHDFGIPVLATVCIFRRRQAKRSSFDKLLTAEHVQDDHFLFSNQSVSQGWDSNLLFGT